MAKKRTRAVVAKEIRQLQEDYVILLTEIKELDVEVDVDLFNDNTELSIGLCYTTYL